MIQSHLTQFVDKRLQALETVDRVAFPESSLEHRASFEQKPPSLATQLKGEKLKFLFEIKKASPTMGTLSQAKALDMCRSYVEQGAKALSVLVDSANFGGHPQDLEDCCKTYPELPFLYKDFVATAYQVKLAKAVGASSVLLMCQLLEKSELQELYALATDIGLEPFVETHDADELEFALSLGAPIIGINSRDFKTEGLPIDLKTAPTILKQLGVQNTTSAIVAQSGVFSGDDLQSVCEDCPNGLPHAIQIGSSLSQTGGIPDWLKERL